MKRSDGAALALAGALFILLVIPLRGAIVDDTFIHLQYARNLAETGQLAFNRGDPTYGATSPLWVALLALVHRAGGDLLPACRLLSWLFAAASIALVYRLALAIAGRTLAPAAAAAIVACEGWFVRWSVVGMETPFAVFMVLAALDAALTAPRSNRRAALFGGVLFLAVLSRPEALALVALSLVAFAFGPGPWPRRWLHVAVFTALFALWLIAIHRHTGSFFPLTAGAKQGSIVLSPAILSRAGVSARIMAATILLPWLALVAGIASALLRRRGLAPFFTGLDGASDEKRPGIVLMILWVFGLPAAYAVFDFQVLSRYLVPVIPVVVVLGAIAWERLAAAVWKGAAARRAALVVFASLAIVQSVAVYMKVVVPPTLAFSRGLETVVCGMGEWLRENSPPDALVAAPDIGAIGYISERRILDLGGLVTPEINAMRRTIDVERIIDEGLYLDGEPGYLLDRSAVPRRFAEKTIRGRRFIPVREGTVANLGIRKPEPVVYVLYRIERAPAEEGQ